MIRNDKGFDTVVEKNKRKVAKNDENRNNKKELILSKLHFRPRHVFISACFLSHIDQNI